MKKYYGISADLIPMFYTSFSENLKNKYNFIVLESDESEDSPNLYYRLMGKHDTSFTTCLVLNGWKACLKPSSSKVLQPISFSLTCPQGEKLEKEFEPNLTGVLAGIRYLNKISRYSNWSHYKLYKKSEGQLKTIHALQSENQELQDIIAGLTTFKNAILEVVKTG